MNKKCTKAKLITSSLACALVQVLPIKHNNFCLTVTDRKLSDGIAGNDRALCRCGIRIPSARNRCLAFAKDKCLELMFGDVGQARTNATMLLMPIATPSSHTCTKPTVEPTPLVKSFSNTGLKYDLSISLKIIL